MKKAALFVLTLALCAAGTSPARAQSFENGDLLVSPGIGFGYFGYGFYGSRTGLSIPLSLAVEKGIHEYISVGPYVGYARYSYEYPGGDYSWTFYSLGARASFHYLPLLNEYLDLDIDSDKFDFYVAMLAGFDVQRYRSDDNFLDDFVDNDVDINIGPVAGFRYYLNPNLGLFFEGGRGVYGWGTIGVTGRF